NGELQVFGFCKGNQLVRLGKLHRDRLLEEHVLARHQALPRHGEVRVLGSGGDVDRLDLLQLQELVVVLGRALRAGFLPHLLQPRGVDVGDVQRADERMPGERLGADAAAPARADHGDFDGFHWLTLMLASLISFAYLSVSPRMKAAVSAGVLLTASTPRSANFFLTSASARIFTVSAWYLYTIGFGVPAGSRSAHQL